MNRRALVLAGLATLPAATVVIPVSAQRRRPARQPAKAKPAQPQGAGPTAQHVRSRIVTRTFRSLVPMVIPGTGTGPGPASIYPSTIRVGGFRQGRILNVRVTLLGFSHERPDNVDILLLAPGNVGIMIMSDAGLGTAVANVSLTLDQNAPGSLPTPLVTGIFQPSNFEVPADVLAPPAPAGVSGHSPGSPTATRMGSGGSSSSTTRAPISVH